MADIADDLSRQQQAILQEYRRQAPRWGKLEINEHLRWVVDQLPLTAQSEVVDIAAGTGLFGRAVASRVARVTAVDITPEMIEQGQRRAQQDGILNMDWQQGTAEGLPFPDECFDLAITRYSVHHFLNPALVLKEMGRVCRPGGRVVVVDIVSDEDRLVAARHDALERTIDATHTSVLSPSRLVQAAASAGLFLQAYLSRNVPTNFDSWQAHIPRDAPSRRAVRRALEEELAGGDRTGMGPFRRDGELWFVHVWGVLLAGKRQQGMH
jgi:ubiquinone/menaquinone biosynthesis C-methylase UbiE